MAGSAVLARVGGALVDFSFTCVAKIAGSTAACEAVDTIVTGTAVLASIGDAIVDVIFAVVTIKASSTCASKLVHAICTLATVLTRRRSTLIHIRGTSST